VMTDRGPDSAGFAIYSDAPDGTFKLTLRGPELVGLGRLLSEELSVDAKLVEHDSHAVLLLPRSAAPSARAWLGSHRPDIAVIGAGERIELYKEVGLPLD